MKLPIRLICLLVLGAAAVPLASAQTSKIAEFQPQAEAGNIEAQFELAKVYLGDPSGIVIDPAKGLGWLRKSASGGYAGAQVALGYLYQNGYSQKGVKLQQDAHEAAAWYRKAASQTGNNKNSDAKAKYARASLSALLAKGLISKREAEWATAKAAGGESASGKDDTEKGGPPPFSLAEVETGLTSGITSKRMATLVGAYGVNFSLSAKAQKRLADQGADDTLIAVISASKH
jgi:hypothetical protein